MSLARRLEAPLDRRTWILAALAAVLVVAAFGWCTAALASRSAAESDSRDSLADQAPTIVATVFSVRSSTWKADRAAARDHLTEPLSATLRPALAVGPPAGVAAVEWAPSTTAVVDVDGDSGSALLSVRVTVTPVTGKPVATQKSVHADFTRKDGRWLLASLDDLS